MILFVLCFGVEILSCLILVFVFIFLDKFAAYWEIAAHSANDIFFEDLEPNCHFSISDLGFWSGNFCLIAPFPDHRLLVPY